MLTEEKAKFTEKNQEFEAKKFEALKKGMQQTASETYTTKSQKRNRKTS